MTPFKLRYRFKPLLVYLFFVFALWAIGLVWFAETLKIRPPLLEMNAVATAESTDAIVVLTGGDERVAAGLDLLAQGKAKGLLISGVHKYTTLSSIIAAHPNWRHLIPDQITLGYAAGDTYGNAVETAEYMNAQGYHSLRLVTAHYHLRRAMLEFRMAMPDVKIIPHPVSPDTVVASEWWRWPGTILLLVREYTKYLLALCRYGIWYFGVIEA